MTQGFRLSQGFKAKRLKGKEPILALWGKNCCGPDTVEKAEDIVSSFTSLGEYTQKWPAGQAAQCGSLMNG